MSLDELLKDIDTLDSSDENIALEVYHTLIKQPKNEFRTSTEKFKE